MGRNGLRVILGNWLGWVCLRGIPKGQRGKAGTGDRARRTEGSGPPPGGIDASSLLAEAPSSARHTEASQLSLLALIGLLAAACGGLAAPPPPGWTGYVPSSAIQAQLLELEGRRIAASDGPLAGAEWRVRVPFSVTPNPTPGSTPSLAPSALLVRTGIPAEREPVGVGTDPPDFRWVPFLCDADCADFVRRAGSSPRFRNSGDESRAYRAVMGRSR